MTRAKAIPHGTTTGYAHYRCRCEGCRAAVAAYQRRRKAAMRNGTWQPDPARGRPQRQMCVGPGCNRLARYVTPMPLCMTHKQQFDRGKELTPPRRMRRVVNGQKQCSRCERVRPVADYNRANATKIHSMCKDCQSVINRVNKYGIPFDEMRALLEQPCSGCGAEVKGREQHVDHCHDTGRVRGILCHNCNTVLTVHMTPEILRRLADYLER